MASNEERAGMDTVRMIVAGLLLVAHCWWTGQLDALAEGAERAGGAE